MWKAVAEINIQMKRFVEQLPADSKECQSQLEFKLLLTLS